MAGDAYILVTVLLTFAASVIGQETALPRCYYMTDAIPREPMPDDLPDLEWNGGWIDWPLIPAEPRDDVCIDGWYPQVTSTSLGTIIIHMEEEIEGDVAIAKLNYDGTGTPEIVQPMVIGSFNLLGPEIRSENGAWYLYITNRQDFETPTMRRYTFDVRVPDETRAARVSLSVENIDDNDPIVRMLDACQVPELGEPRLTDCVYQVSDEDGRLSIEPMTFQITSDRGDDEIFYVEPEHITGDWYNMQITIGIRSALNFESNPLHIFQLTALDSWPNTHTVTVMVQVENVEHRPPRWVEIFAVQQFDEMTEQSFLVRAIDGDTGINKTIHYMLETDEEEDLFSIEMLEGGHRGAMFNIAKIDVDTLRRDVFTLSLVAHKYDNVTFATSAPVVIIVNDINNKKPLPLQDEYTISIMEETPLSLNFADVFGFFDEDLVYAQFTVEIHGEYPPGVEQAFYIAPTMGFQDQTFVMGTQDHAMLDYEDIPFQNIKLKVIATDRDNTDFSGVAEVNVNLINWNDEEPIFEEDQLVVKFKETVPKDHYVGRLRAHDRDIGDSVVHSLLGNANTFLRIDEETGDIYVAIDDAFDYHRQNEFNIQVRAQDTMSEPESRHTATAQLVIELEDVNNTPPTLRLPRGSPSVEENVPEGFEINRDIIATDPDTTAYLQFEIDWDTSYATKQGREANRTEFHGCVDIETIYPNPDDPREAVGRVVAKEIRYNVTIDFEEFEVLYLTVRVRDLHTEEGRDYDESTFTIIIIDMNDNWPIWASGSLDQTFSIRERSSTGVVIGSVLATDIDGPLYNKVRYTIVPREETPEGLVKIEPVTGQITVDENGAIDADVPKRWHLYYTIIASDECYEENPGDCPPPDLTVWNIPGDIVINIIDTNNKQPMADDTRFNETVYIYENAPDFTNVVKLYSNDEDRDEIYHTVRYQINYAVNQRLRDFFAIDLDSGQVYVENTNNELLDRDRGEDQHRIFINLIDNFYSEGDGNRNQNSTEVLVILLDENDNAPELPTPEELSWSISENLQEGVTLDGVDEVIYAPDIDEENTPNSHVGYAILGLTVTNRDLETVPRLLNMLSPNNVTGYLQTAMPLRGYWGTYDISILAFDHGIPQQISHEVYELEIRPYNYHTPQFVFPVSGTTIRLAKERAVVNNVLSLVNGDPLDRIYATDEDGLEAGVVTFEILEDADASNFFRINNDGDNFGTLFLTQSLPDDDRDFEVTIRATDGGTEPRSLSTDSTVTVLFVSTLGDPIFEDNAYTVAFFEKEVGLTERFTLPLAEDPKNKGCTDDCHDIYYRIFGGVDYEPFDLDPVTNVLFLKSELDRETTATHVVQVAASNSPTGGGIPLPGSLLTVTVTVREADPRPVFEQRLYTAGISTADTINRELLTVRASHSEDAPLTYTIEDGSMVVDSTLQAVKDSAFELNALTGVLTLRIQPTASMQGMFEFNVVATDPDEKADSAEVKVYLISSQNRVSFIFMNDVEIVETNKDFIAETFSVGFNMTCNIDQVLPGTSEGVIQEDLAEVHAHFIQNDIPVNADSIEELRSDTQLLRSVQGVLNQRLLVLKDLVTGVSPDVGTDGVQITVYVLAALSAILAFMCLIMLITFIVRTRALNRRLEALSMTKYGSVDSGLNRVGLAAPGTNKHAVEGSNPIWNEQIKAPDFDAISDTSDESDLIGIEDLPQFRSDYYPPEDSESANGAFNDRPPRGNNAPIAHSSNNFGFNTSPFSTEFTNRHMRP